MSKHSLSDSVSDGTISEYTAFCGLSLCDIIKLATKHPDARLLVRFRGVQGDGRKIMTAGYFLEWKAELGKILIEDVLFLYRDIRDVMAVAE
jgi:hypothetical protein